VTVLYSHASSNLLVLNENCDYLPFCVTLAHTLQKKKLTKKCRIIIINNKGQLL